MKIEDLEFICTKYSLTRKEAQKIADLLSEYGEEYERSINAGLTSKNYSEREKAYDNAVDTLKDGTAVVPPATMPRNPASIIYSMDFAIRRIGIEDKDLRRELLWLMTGEDKKLPRVSDAKDKEIIYEEEQCHLTKEYFNNQ